MTRTPTVERVLREYFGDDGTPAPDYVLDVVADRIGGMHQRRSWRLLRRLQMNSYTRLAAAAVIGVIAVGVIYLNLPNRNGVGGESPSPSPMQTATPTPLAEGLLAAGTYRLRPFASATMTIDATVPDGGWLGGPPSAIGGPRGESNGPNGVAVAFLQAQTIHSDPCHWDQDGNGSAPDEGNVEVGPTVDDLAEALAANAAYEATTPTEVTIGGFAGKRVDLQLPPGDCDTLDGNGVYFVFGGREGFIYAQGDGSDWQVSIVDVDGTRLILALFSYAGTSAADLSAAQAIIDSLVITP